MALNVVGVPTIGACMASATTAVQAARAMSTQLGKAMQQELRQPQLRISEYSEMYKIAKSIWYKYAGYFSVYFRVYFWFFDYHQRFALTSIHKCSLALFCEKPPQSLPVSC